MRSTQGREEVLKFEMTVGFSCLKNSRVLDVGTSVGRRSMKERRPERDPQAAVGVLKALLLFEPTRKLRAVRCTA